MVNHTGALVSCSKQLTTITFCSLVSFCVESPIVALDSQIFFYKAGGPDMESVDVGEE